jgi:hypothetical protein
MLSVESLCAITMIFCFENFSAIPPTNDGLDHQRFRVVACSFLFVDMNLCMCADSLIIWGWGEFAG